MKYIFTFLISMVPLVELRGAIPFAIANGIPLWTALLIGVIGNLLPVPLIFFFARSSLAVMLGVILAGLIMGTLSLLLGIDTFAH